MHDDPDSAELPAQPGADRLADHTLHELRDRRQRDALLALLPLRLLPGRIAFEVLQAQVLRRPLQELAPPGDQAWSFVIGF